MRKVAQSAEIIAQSPWPASATLFASHESTELPRERALTLASIAYLKLLGLPFDVLRRHNVEHMSPTGKGPLLRAGEFVVSEFSNIVYFAAFKGHYLDGTLSDFEYSDLCAFIALIDSSLGCAMDYLTWAVDENRNTLTHQRYKRHYPWPLGKTLHFFDSWRYRSELKSNGWSKKSEEEVYDKVCQCLEALTEKLGDKRFFFGNWPSSLDAFIYGHLKALITTDYNFTKTEKSLRLLLADYRHMVHFVTTFEDYFGSVSQTRASSPSELRRISNVFDQFVK